MDKIFIYLLICIVIFLVLREFWCWYFKINKATSLLEEILIELRILNKRNSNKQDDDPYSHNTIEINKKKDDTKKEESEAEKKEEENL